MAGEEPTARAEQQALATPKVELSGEAIMRRQQGKQLGSPIRWLLEWPLMLHAALVLALIWTLSLMRLNYLLVYVMGFIYLLQVENRRSERTRRRIRHEERKNATRKQLLSDLESVHWLNQVLEKAWPAFLGDFASEKFLGPLLPFFLAKYKPWTVQEATVQSFTLGRAPPVFSGLRTLDQLSTDDNLVLEAAMEFVAADDMIAVLSVQLKKRLGALWTKLHISNLHIEGKVRIGVKFMTGWPFVSRLRVSFKNVPYVQITARPVSNIGMDVAELPGIASWLDTMLMDALEDSIVNPNMLVINVERIASSWSGSPIPAVMDGTHDSPKAAVVRVEIMEATQLKAADANGLSDPYVKGLLNGQRFKTTVKRKTLNPKWREEFQLAVRSWDEQNRLFLRVRDKDLFRDDNLGFCEILLSNYRDGNRQELSLPLKGVKTGRLNLAITVEETSPLEEVQNESGNEEETDEDSVGSDQYECINIAGVPTGVFCILRPGRSVRKTWRRRKGRKVLDSGDVMPETLFSGPLDPDVLYTDSDEDKCVSTPSGGRRFWKWTRGLKDKKPVSGELLRVTGDNGVQGPNGQGASRISTPSACDVVSALEENEAASKPVKVQVEPPVVEGGPENELPGSCMSTPNAEPGRRSMKERARGAVKHTAVHLGHSASHLSHSLFRKSSKGREDSGELAPLNLEASNLSP